MFESNDRHVFRQRFGMVNRRELKERSQTRRDMTMLSSEETIQFFMNAPGKTVGLHHYFIHYCAYYKPLPNQSDLADILKKCRTQIAKAMKELWEAEMVWKVKRPNRHPEYYLNPFCYWEGTESARKSHVALLAPYRILPPTRK